MLFVQGCSEKNDEPSGAPSIELSESTVEMAKEGGDKVLTVTATRDWKATSKADWIAVDPTSGKASDGADVTVTVLENTGMDRTGTVEFTIGFDSKTLTVNQKGTGSATELVVYHNDFDKELAVKESSGWKTYLDSFEGWKNETGSGIASVSYAFNGMSARTSSGASNSSYSDYEGSGQNYLWFAKDAYFEVKNITLPENSQNYTVSFGSERNEYNAADNTFKPSEFLVYVSNDGSKWVALEYAFPGELKNRRWDKASSTFTVPSGTKTLYLYVKATVASAYLFDDLDLSVASAAGTAIDFSKGIDLGTGSGETPDPGTDYSKAESKTVAEFIAAADKATYYKLKGTVSRYNAAYCSFDLTDETGTIYVYSTANKEEWSSKVKDGGTVELAGLYDYYDSKSQHEVVKAQILSFTEGETPAPTEIKDVTAAEFNAAEVSTTQLYRLTGTITEIKNTTYGNLMLKDATGEVYIYGVKKDKDSANNSFAQLGAETGDKLTVVGYRAEYNSTIEMTSGYCEKLEKDTTPKFSVSTTVLTANADATSASFDVKGNVKWSVASDNAAYTVNPASGDGEGTVKVSFAANAATTDVTVKLTVSTTADVATKSYTVVLTHKGKSTSAGGNEVTVSVDKAFLAANKDGKMDDVISYSNDSDYGTTTVTELRIYKGKSLTITAVDGYTISKVTFTCTGSVGTKQGFYLTSPVTVDDGATATSEGSGNEGSITISGETSSVKYTASENQMRVTAMSVTYKKK